MKITSVYPADIAFRHVFAKANIPIRHMPPPVYHNLRQKCLAILSTLYVRASSPPDILEKLSHKRIDINVSSPLDPEHRPTPAVLASAFSSVMTAMRHSINIFAVPYPDKPGILAIVEVKYSPPFLFDWSLVHRSYGGHLCNILDASIRTFGLTVNERGLYVRIPEIEDVSPGQSLFFLTRKLDDVLQFMGLDVAEYRAGWTRPEQMFAFLARNRFMTKSAYTRQEVNANYRKKAGQNVYKQFVNDWLPGWDTEGGRGSGGGTFHPQVGGEGSKGWRRDQIAQRAAVLQEALDRFGKRAKYNVLMLQWRRRNKLIQKVQTIYT